MAGDGDSNYEGVGTARVAPWHATQDGVGGGDDGQGEEEGYDDAENEEEGDKGRQEFLVWRKRAREEGRGMK